MIRSAIAGKKIEPLSARPRRHRRPPPLARGNFREMSGIATAPPVGSKVAAMPEPSSRAGSGLPVELEIGKRTDNEGGFELMCRR